MSTITPVNSQELIEKIYTVAVEPNRLEELAQHWQLVLGDTDSSYDFGLLQGAQFQGHLERAMSVILTVGINAQEPDIDSEAKALDSVPTAALMVTSTGHIAHANQAAQSALRASAGGSLSDLPLEDGALEELLVGIQDTLKSGTNAVLVRCRLVQPDRLALFQMRALPGRVPNRVLITTTELTWPDSLTALLSDAFKLTSAEVDVLAAVARGESPKDIAKQGKRSEATVRSHLHALFNKTGARSQVELVRVTLGLLDIAKSIDPLPTQTGFQSSPTSNVYIPTRLPDGRLIHRLEIGDPQGRPFLWWPGDFGLTRWTEDAERELTRRGLRMISIIRAGYGPSTRQVDSENIFDSHVTDGLLLMDSLGIEKCPFAGYGDDFRIMVGAANRAPHRILQIVACGAGLPAFRPEHYARMPMWYRFIRGNARFAPKVAPFLIKAGFGLARRIGQKRFAQSIFSDCAGDLACLDQPDILAAVLLGSEITASSRFLADEAFTREVLAFQHDWTHLIRESEVPITLFHGTQDANSPWATVQEYAQEFPQLKLLPLQDGGALEYLKEWRMLVELIDDATKLSSFSQAVSIK
jgi:DNA-binding NarL/FixJ family response regulator/pimeloyl-ACP methyl ester carboxylesterase